MLFTYFHFAADEALTRAADRQRDHGHRLRDAPRRAGQPAAADADERGRRADEHPGGGEVPRTAPGRARDLARGRARASRRPRWRSWAAGSSGRTPPRWPPGSGRTSGSSTSTSTGSATSTTSCPPTSRPSTPTGTRSSRSIERADLVIGAVLITGARRPRLVRREDLARMKPGAVIVDVAIDQGGCVETSRPTTHREPTYVVDGVVHYCVTNMPGAVGRTSTYALCNVTLPYVLQIAEHGWRQVAAADPGVAEGVNIDQGRVTNQAVAATFGLPYRPLELPWPSRPSEPLRVCLDVVGSDRPTTVSLRRPTRSMPNGATLPMSERRTPTNEHEHEHDHDHDARGRGRGGARGGARARHPEPDLPRDAAAEPRPAEDRRRGGRLQRAASRRSSRAT